MTIRERPVWETLGNTTWFHLEPVGSKLEPPGSRLELLGSRLELLGGILKTTSVNFSKKKNSQNSRMLFVVRF